MIKMYTVLQVRAKVFLAKLESEEGSSNRLQRRQSKRIRSHDEYIYPEIFHVS